MIATASAAARIETVAPSQIATQSTFFCDDAKQNSHSARGFGRFILHLVWRNRWPVIQFPIDLCFSVSLNSLSLCERHSSSDDFSNGHVRTPVFACAAVPL
jgi:hypothetical protein